MKIISSNNSVSQRVAVCAGVTNTKEESVFMNTVAVLGFNSRINLVRTVPFKNIYKIGAYNDRSENVTCLIDEEKKASNQCN